MGGRSQRRSDHSRRQPRRRVGLPRCAADHHDTDQQSTGVVSMQRFVRSGVAALLACSGLVVGAAAQRPPSAASPRIVFVCEHGAAKSVIATAYFNKIAAERGLPDRAMYRGANPQAELSVSALKGLKEDGLVLPSSKPSPITDEDVSDATHIFAIGCALPAHAASSGKA